MRTAAEATRIAQSVRAPRAAAYAGFAFAVIFATVLALLSTTIPVDPEASSRWLTGGGQRQRVEVALGLLPFAGIAFLWFIGVLRDHLAEREDRFFATVFLGSGVLFVAMLFICGAVLSTLIADDVAADADGTWRFGRRLVFTIMNTYALRMAAVFVIATTALAGRLGAIPRWLQLGGFLIALALLVLVTVTPVVAILFPVWVLLLSLQILAAGRRALQGTPDSTKDRPAP